MHTLSSINPYMFESGVCTRRGKNRILCKYTHNDTPICGKNRILRYVCAYTFLMSDCDFNFDARIRILGFYLFIWNPLPMRGMRIEHVRVGRTAKEIAQQHSENVVREKNWHTLICVTSLAINLCTHAYAIHTWVCICVTQCGPGILCIFRSVHVSRRNFFVLYRMLSFRTLHNFIRSKHLMWWCTCTQMPMVASNCSSFNDSGSGTEEIHEMHWNVRVCVPVSRVCFPLF